MLVGDPPPDLRSAYLRGDLAELFQLSPGDTASALEARRNTDRFALAAALRAQARRLGAPAAALRSIDRLEHPRSMAVVTGQQAGLLLGPTYTLSKAFTALSLAASLDSADRPVVPIFWVASQDHDVAEVDHAYLLDASETLRRHAVELPEGVPVGRVPMSGGLLATVLHGLETHAPTPRWLPEAASLLSATAELSRTFSDWFAAQLYAVLGERGLIVLDPMDDAVARLSVPIFEREIADPLTGPAAVNEAARAVRALGFEPQLGRGQGATNLFVELQEGDRPPRRHLLRYAGGAFTAGGARLTAGDLAALVAERPSAVTPAAGLRPVVQDRLLPTAVSVLGPGELAYVAQLRGVYEQHDVPMPLAWPRATVTVVEPAVSRILSTYGLSTDELVRDPDGAMRAVLLARHGAAAEFNRASADLEAVFGRLLSSVAEVDPTLRGTVERGRRRLDATVAKLKEKSAEALGRRDADTRRQFERLKAHLLPLGQPAERLLSPYSHALKFGLQPLLDRLSELPPSGDHLVVL